MLKDLFSNRLFIGALAFFVLCVGGSLLYMQHVEKQTAKALAESEDFQQWWQERNTAEKAVAAEVPKNPMKSSLRATPKALVIPLSSPQRQMSLKTRPISLRFRRKFSSKSLTSFIMNAV